jgi:hypothetical protein
MMPTSAQVPQDEVVTAIRIIAEQCARMRALGMQKWSRPLRDTIFHWWETAYEKRYNRGRKHSVAAGQLDEAEKRVFEHAIPLAVLFKEMLANPITDDSIRRLLTERLVAVVVTKEEDERLTQMQLGRSMPEDWDGVDPYARYRKAGIVLEEGVGAK